MITLFELILIVFIPTSQILWPAKASHLQLFQRNRLVILFSCFFFISLSYKYRLAKSITVRQPTVGAVWYGGQYRFIQWAFNGASPDATISIFIEDILNGYVGKPYPYAIASNLPAIPTIANVAGYRWQVPYTFRTSDGYQIRIVATYPDGKSEPVVAAMNGTFRIVQVGDASNGGGVPVEPKA